MTRVVSLFLPSWSTDRLRRKAGDAAPPAEAPLVLIGRDGNRRVVLAADAAAHAAGLRVGMPVTRLAKWKTGFQMGALGTLLAGVDHMPHTHLPENRMTRGQPAHGAHLADDLERIVALHGAETIAAFIAEPMSVSSGMFPPPVGYFEKVRALDR